MLCTDTLSKRQSELALAFPDSISRVRTLRREPKLDEAERALLDFLCPFLSCLVAHADT